MKKVISSALAVLFASSMAVAAPVKVGVSIANFDDTFLTYMMDNFETELVVMGARIALTTYNLPFKPAKLKNFDEFHQRFGKYILQANN